MKPTLEALLENFRERGAVMGKYKDGTPRCTYEEYDSYRAGHDALAVILRLAVHGLKQNCWCDATAPGDKCSACETLAEIEAALAQGTEARGLHP